MERRRLNRAGIQRGELTAKFQEQLYWSGGVVGNREASGDGM